MENKKALLSVRGLSKSFPGVLALDGVDFDLFSGEVLGICGENGAGKSTLIKCLSGVYQPSAGSIEVDGHEVNIQSAEEGISLGISVIYQELSIISELDIAQNVFLGRVPHYKTGMINFKKLHADTRKIMDHIGLAMDTRTIAGDISISAQQMVEIGKAISRDPKVLIMDEPTSSLGHDETERLFALIEQLKNEGYGIIFISHHMEEVFKITDRVLVLRDGRGIETRATKDWTVDSIVQAMVDRDVSNQFPQKKEGAIRYNEPYAIEVTGLTNRYVHDINLKVRKGEILGLAGIVGAGRSEVLKSIFGAYHNNMGEIKVDGNPVKIKNPKSALASGISFLSEDRKKDMLILMDSIKTNYILPYFKDFAKPLFVNNKAVEAATQKAISQFNIKTTSSEKLVVQLSGGNQQKVLMARVTYGEPDVYLLDEPTRGIDVSVKQEIYKEIIKMAESGSAVILVTSDLPEIIGLADRVLVMRDRTIVAELQKNELSQEAVMNYATGGSQL